MWGYRPEHVYACTHICRSSSIVPQYTKCGTQQAEDEVLYGPQCAEIILQVEMSHVRFVKMSHLVRLCYLLTVSDLGGTQ